MCRISVKSVFLLLITSACIMLPRPARLHAAAKAPASGNTPVFTVSVKDFGAKGNGVDDDLPAFQAANDSVARKGGGIVFVPGVDVANGKFYRLSRGVVVSNGISFVGEGSSSYIKCTHTSDIPVGTSAIFVLGIVSREDLQRMEDKNKYFRIKDISSPSNSIRLASAADVKKFVAGDVVMVSSSEWINDSTDSARPVPRTALWTVVESVNQQAGSMTLRHEVQDRIQNGIVINFSRDTYNKASETNGRGLNVNLFAVRDVSIRNMRLEGGAKYPLYVNGAVNCHFEDLVFVNSNEILRWNSLSHSTVVDIKGQFDMYAIELGLNSSHNHISNISVSYIDRSLSSNRTIILIGERSNRNVLKNISVEAERYIGSKAVEFRGNDNIVDTVTINADGITAQTVSFAEGDNNKVLNSRFRTTGSYKAYWSKNSGSGNEVQNSHFLGKASQQAVQMEGGTDNICRNNYFEYRGWMITDKAERAILESNQFADSERVVKKSSSKSSIIRNNSTKGP